MYIYISCVEARLLSIILYLSKLLRLNSYLCIAVFFLPTVAVGRRIVFLIVLHVWLALPLLHRATAAAASVLHT